MGYEQVVFTDKAVQNVQHRVSGMLLTTQIENFLAEQYSKREHVRRWNYRYWGVQMMKVALSVGCALLAVWLSYKVVELFG